MFYVLVVHSSTTILSCDNSLDNITHKLENDCNGVLKLFADNFMKLNADKKLSFDHQVLKIYQKASTKLSALAHIST